MAAAYDAESRESSRRPIMVSVGTLLPAGNLQVLLKHNNTRTSLVSTHVLRRIRGLDSKLHEGSFRNSNSKIRQLLVLTWDLSVKTGDMLSLKSEVASKSTNVEDK